MDHSTLSIEQAKNLASTIKSTQDSFLAKGNIDGLMVATCLLADLVVAMKKKGHGPEIEAVLN